VHTDRQGLLEFHAGVFVLAVHTQRLCNSKVMEFQATAFGHSEAKLLPSNLLDFNHEKNLREQPTLLAYFYLKNSKYNQ
jgi:hypothetical protein